MLAQAAKRAREPSKQQTNKPNALDQTICPENNYNEHIYLYYIYSCVVTDTFQNVDFHTSISYVMLIYGVFKNSIFKHST